MNARSTFVLSAAAVLAVGLPIVQRGAPAERGGVATTTDAQEFDRLRHDLERLLARAGDPAELERRVVDRTIDYLGLDADRRARFAALTRDALAEVRHARDRALRARVLSDRAGQGERREAWAEWAGVQRAAADRLLDALDASPRHGLFAEHRLLWLLRLDVATRAR